MILEVNNLNQVSKIKSMGLIDVIERMAGYAVQAALLQMTEEIIKFLKENRNTNFNELLRALAEYCQAEGNKELEINASWEIVSQLLIQAAAKLESVAVAGGEVAQSSAYISELEIIRATAESFRRLILVEMVRLWTGAIEEERCYFADLLRTLGNYAEAEANRSPDAAAIWAVVAELIKSAAAAAERPGQELP